MCTLVALSRVHRDFPLIVAANRDELYARRSSGPVLLSAAPRVIGGRDLEKGGTWLGVSAHGFFVGLTNQRTSGPPDAALRSRGEVVLGALEQPGLEGAIEWLARLDAAAYNPFNLLCGDARALYVVYARRETPRPEIAPLAPGIWALPNDRIGSPEFPKVDRAVGLAGPLVELPWEALVPHAQAMLADHALPGLQALCVHTPVYGTVSATLLAIGEGGLVHYLHADGPPCTAPLVDRPELVRALRG